MPDLNPDLNPDLGPDLGPGIVAAAPVSAAAAPAASVGAILWTVIFTFPPPPMGGQGLLAALDTGDLGPDLGPDVAGGDDLISPASLGVAASDPEANTGQSVSVQMLGPNGKALQDYLPGLTYDLGGNKYGCLLAVPPGFTGAAQGILTSGPHAGQTCPVAINLGQAVDLSDVAWTVGPAQTSVADPLSSTVQANSDGFLHFKVSGAQNADGSAAVVTGNPVAVAITTTDPQPQDFQTAQWLTVTEPEAAAGVYAVLALRAVLSNTLAPGKYRAYVQIDGTTVRRVPGYVSAQA